MFIDELKGTNIKKYRVSSTIKFDDKVQRNYLTVRLNPFNEPFDD